MEKTLFCHITLENWRAIFKQIYKNLTWKEAYQWALKWANEECEKMNRTKKGSFRVVVSKMETGVKHNGNWFSQVEFAVKEYNTAYRWVKLFAEDKKDND